MQPGNSRPRKKRTQLNMLPLTSKPRSGTSRPKPPPKTGKRPSSVCRLRSPNSGQGLQKLLTVQKKAATSEHLKLTKDTTELMLAAKKAELEAADFCTKSPDVPPDEAAKRGQRDGKSSG